MRSRFKYQTVRGLLLHLILFAGASLAGLHVHHHEGVADAHVAAGSVCSTVCHETCESEPVAVHLLELLGSAAFCDQSRDAFVAIELHSAILVPWTSGAAFPGAARADEGSTPVDLTDAFVAGIPIGERPATPRPRAPRLSSLPDR
jgi:hypothetical protein